MRLALSIALLSLSTSAFAGGFGLVTTGGVRSDTTYFYDSSANMRQYQLGQALGMGGAGVDLVLGDRDDRILGVFRGYWMVEAPQTDPGERTSLVDPENVVADWRDEPRHVGVASVGLQAGLVGQPSNFQVVGVAALGSGFLTRDHTEYLMGEAGGGVTYMLGRDLQLFGNVVYQMRFRKGFQHGANSYLGIRYLID